MAWRFLWVLFISILDIATILAEFPTSQFGFFRVSPRQTLQTDSSRLIPLRSLTSGRNFVLHVDPGATGVDRGTPVRVDRQGVNQDSLFQAPSNRDAQGSGVDRPVVMSVDPSGQIVMDIIPSDIRQSDTMQRSNVKNQGGQLPDHLRFNKPQNQQPIKTKQNVKMSNEIRKSGNRHSDNNRQVQQMMPSNQMSQDTGVVDTFIDPMQVRRNNGRFNPSDSFLQTSQMSSFDFPFNPAFFQLGEENEGLPFFMNPSQQFMNSGMFDLMQQNSGSQIRQFIPDQRSNNADMINLRNGGRSFNQQRRLKTNMNPFEVMMNNGLSDVIDDMPRKKALLKEFKKVKKLKSKKSQGIIKPSVSPKTKTSLKNPKEIKGKTSNPFITNRIEMKERNSNIPKMSKTKTPTDPNSSQNNKAIDRQQLVLGGNQGGRTIIRLHIEGRRPQMTRQVLMDLLSNPNVQITKKNGNKNQVTTGKSLLSVLKGQTGHIPLQQETVGPIINDNSRSFGLSRHSDKSNVPSRKVSRMNTDKPLNFRKKESIPGIMIPNELFTDNISGQNSFSKSGPGSTNEILSKEVISDSVKKEKKKEIRNKQNELDQKIGTPNDAQINTSDGFISAKPAFGLFQEPSVQKTPSKKIKDSRKSNKQIDAVNNENKQTESSMSTGKQGNDHGSSLGEVQMKESSKPITNDKNRQNQEKQIQSKLSSDKIDVSVGDVKSSQNLKDEKQTLSKNKSDRSKSSEKTKKSETNSSKQSIKSKKKSKKGRKKSKKGRKKSRKSKKKSKKNKKKSTTNKDSTDNTKNSEKNSSTKDGSKKESEKGKNLPNTKSKENTPK